MFVFAMQNPLEIMLAKLTPQTVPFTPSRGCGTIGFDNTYSRKWSVSFVRNKSIRVLLGFPSRDVRVVEGSKRLEGSSVVGIGHDVPLGEFLASLPTPEVKKQKTNNNKKATREKLVKALPWAERGLNAQRRRSTTKVKDKYTSSSESSFDDEEDPKEHLKDEDARNDRRLEELEVLRSKYEDRDSWRIQDFVVKVLGTKWTWEHKGKAADNIEAHAVSELVCEWCEAYRVPKSFRAEIDKYDAANAATLCRAWCSNMQHYFNRALLQKDYKACVWGVEDRKWVPPKDVEYLRAAFHGNRDGLKRIAQITRLFE